MNNFWFCFLVFAVSCAHKPMTTEPSMNGSIEGHVSIGPLRPGPVHVDQQEPPVPPEMYASHKLVVLSHDGKNKILESTIDSQGNYFVEVPAGAYLVDVQPHDIGFGNFVPQEVLVQVGKTVRQDISIDTGMR